MQVCDLKDCGRPIVMRIELTYWPPNEDGDFGNAASQCRRLDLCRTHLPPFLTAWTTLKTCIVPKKTR